MGRFLDWLNGLFRSSEGSIQPKTRDPTVLRLELTRLAIQSAVNLLAASVAQCDFRTFYQHKEIQKKEWFRWNVAPNCNENSTQFIQQMVRRLLYDNEAVLFEADGGLWLADSWNRIRGGTTEDLYIDLQVAHGTTRFTRSASDVLHLQYNDTQVSALLAGVCQEYEDLIAEVTKSYRKSFAEKGIVTFNALASGNTQQREAQDDLFNNKFRKFFEADSAVLPLPNGYAYTPQSHSTRNASEMNDVKLLADDIYNRVGQAFRIPPALLRGEVADLHNARENLITFGVVPIVDQIAEEINAKIYKQWINTGSYMLVDVTPLYLASLAQDPGAIDKLIACGVWSVDEARMRGHEAPLLTEASMTHWITKNYDAQNSVLKEGEGNA